MVITSQPIGADFDCSGGMTAEYRCDPGVLEAVAYLMENPLLMGVGKGVAASLRDSVGARQTRLGAELRTVSISWPQ